MVGGVSVKKNELTDKYYGKCSKGFYAALGLSVLMIGAACLFAHNQGDKIADTQQPPITHDAAVNKPVTNIPKATTPAYRVTTAAPVYTEAPRVTLPAAEITVDAPTESDNSFVPELSDAQSVAAPDNMQNASPPLADISNIIAPFSNGELVKNETTGSWQTHNGTDIAAETGTEVFAVASGEITLVKNDPLWGVTVTVDHKNGYITRYCGLASDLAVQQGDKIESGSIIGTVGDTADIESSLAPHIHIEMTHNGKYIDPMSLINQ